MEVIRHNSTSVSVECFLADKPTECCCLVVWNTDTKIDEDDDGGDEMKLMHRNTNRTFLCLFAFPFLPELFLSFSISSTLQFISQSSLELVCFHKRTKKILDSRSTSIFVLAFNYISWSCSADGFCSFGHIGAPVITWPKFHT